MKDNLEILQVTLEMVQLFQLLLFTGNLSQSFYIFNLKK